MDVGMDDEVVFVDELQKKKCEKRIPSPSLQLIANSH